MLQINPSREKYKITSFIKNVLRQHGFKKVVIGMSGGVDSTTAFYLLKEVVAPENIIIAHLYHLNSQFGGIEDIVKKADIPKENIYEMSIDPLIKTFNVHLGGVEGLMPSPPSEVKKRTHLRGGRMDSSEVDDAVNHVRLGNIMARIRMIILYDLAKKHNALACGTENRSEFLLGYFTRFGDEASDFEPIQHLYKTQIYDLANFLKVPKNIIGKTPTAGLWLGQTDEKEFGFSYKEADEVLFYYYDKKLKIEEIKKKGLPNTEAIINFANKNAYKHHAPYTLEFSI